MPSNVIGTLPPGTYLLDCSPYGPPKLLSKDPNKLTPQERLDICTGSMSHVPIDVNFKLEPNLDGDFVVTPKGHEV